MVGVEYFTLDEARLEVVLSILPWMRLGWGVEYFTLDEARLGILLSILPWMRPSWRWC